MRAAIQMGLGLDGTTQRVHPDGLLRAKECATKGLCIFCEAPLEHELGRPRIICRRKSCKTAYFVADKRDRRFFDKYTLSKTFRDISRHLAQIVKLAEARAPQAPK